MKVLLLLGLLVGFAALNLVANFTVPGHLKLLLVPAFAASIILAVATTRRPRG